MLRNRAPRSQGPANLSRATATARLAPHLQVTCTSCNGEHFVVGPLFLEGDPEAEGSELLSCSADLICDILAGGCSTTGTRCRSGDLWQQIARPRGCWPFLDAVKLALDAGRPLEGLHLHSSKEPFRWGGAQQAVCHVHAAALGLFPAMDAEPASQDISHALTLSSTPALVCASPPAPQQRGTAGRLRQRAVQPPLRRAGAAAAACCGLGSVLLAIDQRRSVVTPGWSI